MDQATLTPRKKIQLHRQQIVVNLYLRTVAILESVLVRAEAAKVITSKLIRIVRLVRAFLRGHRSIEPVDLANVSFQLVLPRRPMHGAPAQQVEVEMVHSLPAVGTAVDHCAKAI